VYAEKKEAAGAAWRQWQSEVKQAVANGETLPSMPKDAQELEEPNAPRVMIADASTEEVAKLLARNHHGLVLVRSELSGWLGQFDRYGGAGADRAFYLETWDGGSHVIDRVKFNGVPLRVPYASLAIVGSLQPDHLRKVFDGINDGLAARFIYVWPTPVPPQRPDRLGAEGRIRTLRDAFAKLRRLNWDCDDSGDPVPMILRLEESALKILDKVREEAFEANQTRGAGLMTGWRGKNPGRLLRLALVFELLQWAVVGDTEPMSISAEMTARAADFLDYSTSMMGHVFRDLLVTDADRDVASLARLIKASSATLLNEREIYQKEGFHRLRDKKHRENVFAKLVEAGWIRRADAPTGGRPRGDWNVNPKVREH
jgi:putative DNA primase/helicase